MISFTKFKDLKSFLKTMNESSKRFGAGTTCLKLEYCKAWDGCDIYIVHAIKGTSKAAKLKAFKDLLKD